MNEEEEVAKEEARRRAEARAKVGPPPAVQAIKNAGNGNGNGSQGW